VVKVLQTVGFCGTAERPKMRGENVASCCILLHWELAALAAEHPEPREQVAWDKGPTNSW
jgi:hypothetical protein